MRAVGIGILLVLATLTVQASAPPAAAIRDLHDTLIALKDARAPASSLSQRLTGDMMALATADHRPSRPEVVAFSGELTRTLRVAWHAQPIQQSPLRIGDLSRKATEIHVEAGLEQCIRRFLAIAESVRGPDDSPLDKD